MKICIDAGHYGKYNKSPADSRYYESDFTWKLHLLQKKYLEEYGIEVITTRPDQNTDRGLYSRGAASEGCVLFISDHTNAVGTTVNDLVDYPAAYCVINGSADGIGMALAQCVEQVIGTRQPARIEHRRGSNGDYYGVLRGAAAVGTPGLILEHSFHTNTQIVRWLRDEENIDRLARAEAKTIALYYNILDPIPEKKSGWIQEDGGWRFYLGNTGEPVRNDWYQDGGEWYWFDGAGMMVYDNWKTDDNGTWYYLNENGAMARNQWVVWKDELYRVTEDGSMFEGGMCLETDEKGALIWKENADLGKEDGIGRMKNITEEVGVREEVDIQEEGDIQEEADIREEVNIQGEGDIREKTDIQEKNRTLGEGNIQANPHFQKSSGSSKNNCPKRKKRSEKGNCLKKKVYIKEKSRLKKEDQPSKEKILKRKHKNSKKNQNKRNMKKQKKGKTAIQANLSMFLFGKIEGFTTQDTKGKRGTGKK